MGSKSINILAIRSMLLLSCDANHPVVLSCDNASLQSGRVSKPGHFLLQDVILRFLIMQDCWSSRNIMSSYWLLETSGEITIKVDGRSTGSFMNKQRFVTLRTNFYDVDINGE